MNRDVIVIGASAGGVEPLRTIVGGLPRDLPAAVLVVLHVPSYGGSVLPAILARAGQLPARVPEPGERLAPGTVYVAPPDQHLIVRDDHVTLTRGPRENGHRPAVDVLFRSAARAVGARAIGVVLSGVLDDGTAGLATIRAHGGLAVVQDPADALYPAMPANAAHATTVDHVLPAADIAALLTNLAAAEVSSQDPVSDELTSFETELAMMDDDAMNAPDRPGMPSGYSCPDCNGVLFQIDDGRVVRFRCRVGHAWSPESLLGEQSEQLEAALWMALRGLEEKAALSRSLGQQAQARGSGLSARRFGEQAHDATRAATLIRSMLEAHVGLPDNDRDTALDADTDQTIA